MSLRHGAQHYGGTDGQETHDLLQRAHNDPNFDWGKVVKPTPEAVMIFQSQKNRETRKWGGPMRTVALLVLPLIVLGTTTVTRLCLSELTFKASEDNRDDWDMPKAYAWIMLWLLIPSAATALMCMMISAAREKANLGAMVALWVIIGAVAEAAGQSLLFLYVLPKLDRVNSIVLVMAVLLLPGLNDATTREPIHPRDRILSLGGVLLMAGGLGAFLYYLEIGELYWLAPVALMLSSTPWAMRNFLFPQQERYRHTAGFIHATFKTIFLFAFGLAIWAYNSHQLNFLWRYGFQRLSANDTIGIVAIVGLCSSLAGCMFSWWSCSMCFQRLGFALPLTLSAPCAVALALGYQIYYDPDDGSADLSTSNILWRVLCFAAMMAGQCIVTRFVWRENDFPVPLAKALFKRDTFNAVLLEATMLANRREKTLRLKLRRRVNLSGSKENDLMVETVSQSSSEAMAEDDEKPVNILLATTMWHESVQEMSSVLKAYSRLDKETSWEQLVRFEIHILFDDAFRPDGEYSEYVELLLSLIDHKQTAAVLTPYGAQLTYRMPKGTELYIHLKDSAKIKNRKRWSQVMYLFYFLRYRMSKSTRNPLDMSNTFVLTTDGDVQFDIPSVQDLLIYLKRNEIVGAVCGRVHPRGAGAVAWVQYFEYALAHWMQKATEQVLGSVMCMPGAFTMYRAAALEEVMYIYAKTANSGREFLQCDQGEDRWLSTLLLQKGWLLQYSASADCYTFCPETFEEFYNQRRRWITSTMANILDLIFTASKVVRTNISINYFFIFYQAVLLLANIISPTVVMMLMASCFTDRLVNTWMMIVLTGCTYVTFAVVCYFCSTKVQLRVAKMYTFILSFFMIFILISTIREIAKDPTSLVAIGLLVVACAVVASAFFHPRELYNFFSGAVYLLAIPSLYVILFIYSLANINNVGWGTREKKSAEEIMAEEEAEKQPSIASRWRTIGTTLMFKLRKERAQKEGREPLMQNMNESAETLNTAPGTVQEGPSGASTIPTDHTHHEPPRAPSHGLTDKCPPSEWKFWEVLMTTYLTPEDVNSVEVVERHEAIRDQLTDLRSMSLVGCVGTNIVLSAFYVVMRFLDDTSNESSKVALALQAFFVSLIVIQFVCMLWHRWLMVMHVVATAKFQ